MAKNNVFYKLPAQLLLQDKSVTFSGYLERKIKVLGFKTWLKCYTVISDGNIYIYQTNTSAKPSLVCVLSAFDHIQIYKNRKQPPIWVFSLTPIIDSVPEMKFAAPSEREMESWICELRMGIVHSKNSQLQKSRASLSFVSIDEELDGSIYSTIYEKNQVRNVLLNSNKNNIYEEPDTISYKPSTSTPSAPPLMHVYPALSFDKHSLVSSVEENDENSVFYGSREEALKQLSLCKLLGSYLVRIEDDKKVLTVRCESNIVKYCLLLHPQTARMYIAGQSLCFESLDQLLCYYHEHNLPNQNCKLLLPYKLVNENDL